MKTKIKLNNSITIVTDTVLTFDDINQWSKSDKTIPKPPEVIKDLKGKYEFGHNGITMTQYSHAYYNGEDQYSLTKYSIVGSFEYDKNGYYKSGKVEKWSVQDIFSSNPTFDSELTSAFYQNSEGGLKISGKQLLFAGTDKKLTPFYLPKELTHADGVDDNYGEWVGFYKLNNISWYKTPFEGDYIKDTFSLYNQYYSALTSGNAALTSKDINWKTFSDFSSADSSFYSALEWSSVNISNLQKFQGSAIDWNKVQYSEFSSKQYKQINWSQVPISSFTSDQYQAIDWGQVSYRGSKSISYSQVSWSKVDFGDFSIKTFKQVDWSQVKTSDLTSEQYAEIKWGSVSFSGKTSINYSSLDWSQVITASGFNAAAYKSVNWGQVDFGDFKQQTFAITNWNQVNFKQLSVSQYQAINWNEINLGALSTKTYQAIDWKKVNVAAFDSDSISTAKWGLMKGVTKPTAAAKPAEADLSFLGVTAPAGTTAGLVGAAGQSSSNQLIGALTGTKQGQVLPV